MAQISLQSLQYVVNHVILPPQLPSSAESSEVIQLGEQYLLQIVLQSVQELSPRSSNHEQPAWASLEQTLRHWRIIQDGGTLSTELLICWLADTRPNGNFSPPINFWPILNFSRCCLTSYQGAERLSHHADS